MFIMLGDNTDRWSAHTIFQHQLTMPWLQTLLMQFVPISWIVFQNVNVSTPSVEARPKAPTSSPISSRNGDWFERALRLIPKPSMNSSASVRGSSSGAHKLGEHALILPTIHLNRLTEVSHPVKPITWQSLIEVCSPSLLVSYFWRLNIFHLKEK